MPGGGRYHFEADREVPWPATVLFILVFVNFAITLWLMSTIDRWAKQFPTAGHWYEYRMMGGVTYYLSPRMGWYLGDSLWIHFGGFVLIFLITYLAGVRWKRIR